MHVALLRDQKDPNCKNDFSTGKLGIKHFEKVDTQ